MKLTSTPLAAHHVLRAALACALLLALPAWAATAVVTHLAGVLTAEAPNGQTRILSQNSEVAEGEVLNSEAKTFARLRFADGSNLVIRPNSRIKVEAFKYKEDAPADDKATINVLKGGMRMVTGAMARRNPDKFETQTPTATIGIRGTHYGVLVCQGDCAQFSPPGRPPLPDGTYTDVLTGAIAMTNPTGTVTVGVGQFGYVPNLQVPPAVIPPDQGIRVTIPPAMVASQGGGLTLGLRSNDAQCVVR